MGMNVNVTQLINNWFPALSLFAEQKPLTESIIPTLCVGHRAKEVPAGVTFVDSDHHGNSTHLQPQPRCPRRCVSCPALGTGLEFAELKGYMSNSAGKMGFFRFNFWSLSNCIAFFNQPSRNLESGLEKDIFKFKKQNPAFLSVSSGKK